MIVMRTNQPPLWSSDVAVLGGASSSTTLTGTGAATLIDETSSTEPSSNRLFCAEAPDVPNHDGDDGEEQDDCDRGAATVVIADEEPLDHAFGNDLCLVRFGVDDYEHDVENLHRVDHHVRRHDHDRRQHAGHDDAPEHLQLRCAVDASGFDDLVGDRLDRRRQHDHGETGLH